MLRSWSGFIALLLFLVLCIKMEIQTGWLTEQAALLKPDCHPVHRLLLRYSPQSPLYHPVALNGPPSYWSGLWPRVPRPGVQIWISIKGSLWYHCHLWSAVGRLVGLKEPIMRLWLVTKTCCLFSVHLLVTLPVCMYGYSGRPLWWLWNVWPSPEPTTHLASRRKWQLSHRKWTLSHIHKKRTIHWSYRIAQSGRHDLLHASTLI